MSLLAIAFIIYARSDVTTMCFVLFIRVIVTGVLAIWSNLSISLRLFLNQLLNVCAKGEHLLRAVI